MSKQEIRVLVADDDLTTQLLARAALEKSGFTVFSAGDGIDALRMLQETRFDMAILDVAMPGADGFEVCRAVRDQFGQSLPIAMLTSRDDTASIERAYDCGATDFIPKPLNWTLLGHRMLYLWRASRNVVDLAAAGARNHAVLDALPHLFFELDAAGRFVDYRVPRGDLSGVSRERYLGLKVSDVLPADAAAVCLAAVREASEQGLSLGRQYRLPGSDGDSWFELSVSRVAEAAGRAPSFIVLAQDVTIRKKTELRLQQIAGVFESAREGIMITDAAAIILDVNPTFTEISGYSREEVLGRPASLLRSDRQEAGVFSAMWRELSEKGHWQGELWNRRKNGEMYAVALTVSAIGERHGDNRQYVGLFSDITRQKEYHDQLERAAYYDAVTALPNRLLLTDRLQRAMAHARRRDLRLVVASIDIDGFKAVNDAHGHHVGDRVLASLATRLREELRDEDTIARLGGDELIAVLGDLPTVSSAVPLIERLRATLAQPLQIDGNTLCLTASVGFTGYPQNDPASADQLLQQASQAMCQAKLTGRDRYHLFDAEKDRALRHDEGLERLRQALAGGELVLHYQPQVNMRTGEVLGVEALLRWQHPARGLLMPAAFLPATEGCPLAVELSDWVFATVLSQIETWQAQGLDLRVSVNVSAAVLLQADFVARLADRLAACSGAAGRRIAIEVPEAGALGNVAHSAAVIADCAALGVGFAVDDFGTGHGSLADLRRLSTVALKIDCSVVGDLLLDPANLATVEGMLGMARAFRLEVIAEGVESVEHGAMLLRFGCERAQGYAIARPIPANELSGWLRNWRPPAQWANCPPLGGDLPLLYPAVEYGALLRALDAYCRDALPDAPRLQASDFRFGQWLVAASQTRRAEAPAFQAMLSVHGRLHAESVAVVGLQGQGRRSEAAARLTLVRTLYDELLAAVAAWIEEAA
ncbi:EAL domain-containing protein [Accumulibacter sp.]|uniref:two-component system response regulator n=1 Tax=Accumulibacter sp. TaxID=2053492 RepID=UPI0026219543|nr:EAL domain-containing protein [Accumulibacter sp.]